ncbi:hypothetical protein DHEL01_v202207 [Diaporthe helianthi]|uniref:Uncharacterized protein n=1 Tax=Diaporthe helianthi TaxID=158607 RepID=A0A2P5IA90_DIAHE|nr:hypothetical protein DHEL01_v202207 [Diaporthe helianthi]
MADLKLSFNRPIVAEENKRRATEYEASYALWEAASAPQRGPAPESPALTTIRDKAIRDRLEEQRKDYPLKTAFQNHRTRSYHSLN